jgi:hypothetical protein
VPLVIKGTAAFPGLAPGSRSRARAWLPDVAATLATLGGTGAPEEAEGIDLTRADREGETRIRRAWSWAPEDELGWPTLTAVDDGGGWRSFTWDELPGADEEGGEASPLALARSRPATPRKRELPEALLERLRSEGLIEDTQESVALPEDPADRDMLLAKLQLARFDLGRGNFGGAGIRVIRARKEYPDNLALMEAALYFRTQSQPAPAAELAAEALDRYPLRPEILHRAGHALQRAGESAKGELLLESALALRGSDAELDYDLACARALDGDADGAFDRLARAIEAGFRNWTQIEQDPDLVSIRGDPRYGALLGAHGR